VTRIRAAFLALCACNRCSLLARTALEACGPRDSGQSRARGAVGAVRAQSIRPALRCLRPIGRSPRRAAYGGGGTEVYRGGGDRAGRAVDDYGPRCRRRRRARRQPGSLTRSQPGRRRHHRLHHSNPSFCCSECLASAVGCTASRPQSAQNSLRPGPGVKLTWRFVSSVVPSQTGGLVHSQAIKPDSTPLQSTIKLFKWAGPIKI
jgi:hypothetical protein